MNDIDDPFRRARIIITFGLIVIVGFVATQICLKFVVESLKTSTIIDLNSKKVSDIDFIKQIQYNPNKQVIKNGKSNHQIEQEKQEEIKKQEVNKTIEEKINDIKNNINQIEIKESIIKKFGDYGLRAIAIAECESGLDPTEDNLSGAKGLFQIMPVHEWRIKTGKDFYDVETNIDVAYELFIEQMWNPWVSSKHCWNK